MEIRFYNTLTREKEELMPLRKGEVRMYNCGPTVYNYAHIGNFRSYIFADMLRRFLEYSGYSVKQVMNITDVDDKTIRDSRKAGKGLKAFTEVFIKAFFQDLDTLNIKRATHYPRATEHIKEMVALIEGLMKKGYAYKSEDGSIYFNIRKFNDYGRLAHLDMEGLKAGARVKHDDYEKESARDFALWKAWDNEDGDVFWETSLGKGRPGWHIECSAMSIKYLGETLDIHSGGSDLIFPHHQNEISQTEAFTGKRFSNLWMHNEHLIVDGKKMSKSLGNFYTLRDLLEKGYNPKAIRYLLLSAHYRTKLNFSEEGLKAAEDTVRGIENLVMELREVSGEGEPLEGLIAKAKKGFDKSMADDLNVPEALSRFFEFTKEVSRLISENRIGRKQAGDVLDFMFNIDSVLGLGLENVESWKTIKQAKKEVRDLILEREKLREEKRWKESDHIRNSLKAKGIIIQDTKEGPRWRAT